METKIAALRIDRQIVYTYDNFGRLIQETHNKPAKEEESLSEFYGVTAFVDVPNDEVQEYLNKGYYIYKVYQKNTILMRNGDETDG